MIRHDKYIQLQSDTWYKRLFIKLKNSDIKLMESIILDNKESSHDEFKRIVRIYFEHNKTKNWLIIEEILGICNDSLISKRE